MTMMSCACLMAGIVGCGNKSAGGSGGSVSPQTPGDAVIGYMKAFKAGNFEETYEDYVTDESAKMIKHLMKNNKGVKDKLRRKAEMFKNATFSVTDTKIDVDTATVTVKTSGRMGETADKNEHFPLKKINGKWKIDLIAMQKEIAEKVAGAIEAISEEEGDKAKSAIEETNENTIKKLGE